METEILIDGLKEAPNLCYHALIVPAGNIREVKAEWLEEGRYRLIKVK